MNSGRDTNRLQRLHLHLALPLLSAVLILSVAGCRASASAAGTSRQAASISQPADSPGPYDEAYYYYPANEVYYSPTRSTYYWYEGENWKTGTSLPTPYVIDSSSPVTVNLGTSQPYMLHRQTMVKYPRAR